MIPNHDDDGADEEEGWGAAQMVCFSIWVLQSSCVLLPVHHRPNLAFDQDQMHTEAPCFLGWPVQIQLRFQATFSLFSLSFSFNIGDSDPCVPDVHYSAEPWLLQFNQFGVKSSTNEHNETPFSI